MTCRNKPTKLERYLLQVRLVNAMEELTKAFKTHANTLNLLIQELARKK